MGTSETTLPFLQFNYRVKSPEPQKSDPAVYATALSGPRGSYRPVLLKLGWDFSHHPPTTNRS